MSGEPDPLDPDFWERHWTERPADAEDAPDVDDLDRATVGTSPGVAIDAGCGDGRNALELARRGWRVVGVDRSTEAVARATARASAAGLADRATFEVGDLATWAPAAPADLVTSVYAHPDLAHDAFTRLLAGWVAPGGRLLVVGHGDPRQGHEHGHGHGHDHEHEHAHGHEHQHEHEHAHGHEHGAPGHDHDEPAHDDRHGTDPADDFEPPESTWLPAEALADALPATGWRIESAERRTRRTGPRTLHDVVLLATREG